MLPIKKLYIDSRFKSLDSASDSDFKIDLPQNLLMPEATGFYIDDISIPCSWYPITAGFNNNLYVELYDPPDEFIPDGVSVSKKITIEEGNFTAAELSGRIQDGINNAFSADGFTVSCQFNAVKDTITITRIGAVREWAILTDLEIVAKGFPAPHASMNNVINNHKPQVNTVSFKTGHINLFPIRNLYLVASGLGSFNTMSVSGERSIIKKIPVNANYGEMIFDQSLVGIDYLDCSRQTLSRLSFQLKDVFGNLVDLHNQHWSFSIVFSRISEIM
jgi:hypothetical protein